MGNYLGIMRKIAGILESAPRGERSAIITLRAHASLCVNSRTCVQYAFTSLTLHTRLLASAWEAHHPPILKKAKGARQLQLHYSMPRSCSSWE